MIPSIVTSDLSSALRPQQHNAIQAPPLNISTVIRDSRLESTSSGCDARTIGKLSWLENEKTTTLNSRIDFINKITESVLDYIPSREMPITFVSLGSGGLLTEYFIHQQLEKSGYKDISWRVIDPDYQQGGFECCRKEFREKVNGHVKAFTAEKSYSNKSLGDGDKKLAENDKIRGAVVALTINPPTILSSEEQIAPSFMVVRGNAVNDISKANAISIYMLVSNSSDKDAINHVINRIYSEDQFIVSENLFKCSINNLGYPEVSFSQSQAGNYINNKSKAYLNSLHAASSLGQQKIDLTHIDKALDKFISKLPEEGAFGAKVFASDYDVSTSQLNHFFSDSPNKALFAFLDKNETFIETIK